MKEGEGRECEATPEQGTSEISPEDAARLRVLAEKLRAHRDRVAIMQEELAERADLGRSMIATLERGAYLPRKRARRKLADALGIPVEDLFEPPNAREG